MDAPLVSCVMPTRNRRRFVAQSVAYFLRQDLPARELIVVDDGDEAVRDLIPPDPRIRYARLENRETVGAKRNIGCAMARGDLIAHWDDDDWQAANRLSVQAAVMQERHVQACGVADLLYYAIREGRAYRYQPLADDPPWLAGCSLMYRRSVWSQSPFPPLNIGEDTAFVRVLAGRYSHAALHPVADSGWLVALLHGTNTGPKNLRDPRFRPADIAEVTERIMPDRSFYVGLRTGRWPRPADAAPREDVTIVSDLLVHEGYGAMAEYVALGMARDGADVRLSPLRMDPRGLAPQTLELLKRTQPGSGGPTLYSSWLRPEYDRLAAQTRELVVATMWESSVLPADWPGRLNRALAIVVPTTYVRDVMHRSGVTRPVFVVPDGIDPEIYHLMRRPDRETLTTLVVAAGLRRKHLDVALHGWLLAFGDDPDARLLAKTTDGALWPQTGDPRITVRTDRLTRSELAGLYRGADVLLALGNEGFGLPLVEAMATGLPVVALSTEGQADVCRDAPGLVLAVPAASAEEASEPGYGRCGSRGVPDAVDVARRLRWVAGHRGEARELGAAASAWAVRHRNVWRKGPVLLDVLERACDPPRPLRRHVTVWASSLGANCGVAEYTGHLLRALGSAARGTAQPPDPRRVRLLHLEHENGLYDDAELAVHAERFAGRLVVTEHSMSGQFHPWEARAAALVTLTARGASLLAARCPGSHVEHIPHGCSAWFPPRKRQRGRVVGTFGFLEQYKGVEALLSLPAHIPGIELVFYSHPKRAADVARFGQRIKGLPVRWHTQFLAEADVARRLAAECDVLVFWYDATTLAATSGAARVGLATGVPVVTSRTHWFEDLAEVTYQPDDLVDGIRRVLDDTALRHELTAAAREHCETNTWRRIARRHLALWQSVGHESAATA